MAQRQRKQSFQGWNTPPEVLTPLHEFERVSLDPCSNPHSLVRASVALEAPECDGLTLAWHQYRHTFVNPPYDDQPDWMFKAYLERCLGAQHITMLIPASTETVGFQQLIFGTCDVVCFWRRRIKFWRDGAQPTAGGNTLPSALCYWGEDPERFAAHFAPYGACATEWTKHG